MSLTTAQQTKLDHLVQWVSARVDELMPNAQTPDAPIPYINEELDKSALYVLRSAKKQLVYAAAKVISTDAVSAMHDGKLIVTCPADYVRFLRIKLKGWKRPADQIISVDANRYRQQSNKFLSGDDHKPVATLIPWNAGSSIGFAIEASPGSTQANPVEYFFYVPRLKCYEMPEDLEDPMVWLTASRTLSILRQPKLAEQAMQNMVQSMSQLLVGLYGEEMPSVPQSDRG